MTNVERLSFAAHVDFSQPAETHGQIHRKQLPIIIGWICVLCVASRSHLDDVVECANSWNAREQCKSDLVVLGTICNNINIIIVEYFIVDKYPRVVHTLVFININNID